MLLGLAKLATILVGSVITYPLMQVTDDSGNIVSGATVSIASVTDKAGNAIASPGAAVNLAGPNVSVDYDAAAHGEAWVTLAISKVGSSFSNANASPAFYLAGDSGRLLTALPAVAPSATGGLPTLGTGAGQISPDGTGAVPQAMAATLPASPTAGTVGSALAYGDSIVSRRGTAQGGTSSTITLDTGSAPTDGIYRDHLVILTGGTGAGQSATVTGYVGATKVATIARPGGLAWTTTPDATTKFAIVRVPLADMQPAVAFNNTGQTTALPTSGGGGGSSYFAAGSVSAGSTTTAVVVANLPTGKSYVGQHLLHVPSGESRVIAGQTLNSGLYTFMIAGTVGTSAPYSAAPSPGDAVKVGP